jgi:hypothetical protein
MIALIILAVSKKRMDMAWRKRIIHLHIESDSKILLVIVIGSCNINENMPSYFGLAHSYS